MAPRWVFLFDEFERNEIPYFEILGPNKNYGVLYIWCVSFHCCCHWSCSVNMAEPSTNGYLRQVEALCSWRGLEELKKGTAQAQAALEFGDLFATWGVPGIVRCQGAKGWRADDPRQFAPLTAERVSLLRPCCETGVTGFTFSLCYFCFGNVFWAFGFEGFEQKWCQDLCQTTMIGLFWLVLFQVIVGLLLLPMLVCVGQHREGMVRPSARMTTLNQGRQRLPGGKARLVSNSTRGQVSVWGFHVNASIGKDGCATNERQVNSTYQTPSLTGSGAAWRTRQVRRPCTTALSMVLDSLDTRALQRPCEQVLNQSTTGTTSQHLKCFCFKPLQLLFCTHGTLDSNLALWREVRARWCQASGVSLHISHRMGASRKSHQLQDPVASVKFTIWKLKSPPFEAPWKRSKLGSMYRW